MGVFSFLVSKASLLFLLTACVLPIEERIEQRAVLKFLVKTGLSPIECWRKLSEVHGINCMSKNCVRVWHKKFRNGWTDTKDQKRGGRRKSVRTPETIDVVRDAVGTQRRCTVRELASELSISNLLSSAHNILKKDLRFSKIAPKFIPKILTQQQKDFRKRLCEENIERVREEPTLLEHVITTDESWLSVFELETKQASSEWHPKGTRLERPVKALKQRSERKCMATVFFDRTGMVHLEFKPPGINVTSETYCGTLCQMKESVRRKRPQLWRQDQERDHSFLLHQDNASSHTAVPTLALLGESGIQMLSHPPYSPDLAPCDFFLFPRLKEMLRGVRFPNILQLQDGVRRVLNQIPKREFAVAMDSLPTRWMKCVKAGGDYFEGKHLTIDPEGDHGIQFDTDSEFNE